MTDFADLITAVFKPIRQIGPYSMPQLTVAPLIPITAQVTIEEVHSDELEITSHPVEYGASISDHAFKKPNRLVMKLGWSNSGIQAALQSVVGLIDIFTGDQSGDFNYMQTQYSQLLQLQEARIPFDVSTGKRQYSNMLIRSLTVETTSVTEHALLVTMFLEEVIIVTTSAISFPDASVLANPQSNTALTNVGGQQLKLTGFNDVSNAGFVTSLGN